MMPMPLRTHARLWGRSAALFILGCLLLSLANQPAARAGEHAPDLSGTDLVVIDFEHVWNYSDSGADPGPAWHEPGFDDRSWRAGPALLGYDTSNRRDAWPLPGLRTELQPGHITYLFRTTFDYHGPTEGVALRLDQVIDDAAVYYLNGQEIGRTPRLPDGAITFDTPATTWTNPSLELDAVIVDEPPLRQGRNVLAVSVHNQSTRSSDICFGLRVRVVERPVPPLAMYLTWQRDPTTTMTIQWHAEPGSQGATLQYAPRGSKTAPARITPAATTMPHTGRTIYTAELNALTPDTEYVFRLLHPAGATRSAEYWFRTMPSVPDRPIRLAFGGDVRHRQSWMEAVNRQAARFDPDAIVWGGDLAYADGLAENFNRWEEFFDACMNTLVTPSGRVIPIIVGIGNHEVLGGYYWGQSRGRDAYENTDAFRERIAPFFYSMFAFPGHPGYGVLDFGNYMSILMLDTDHSGPIEGTQTDWLRTALRERAHVTHVLPVYHVPAYPSVRDYHGAVSARVREHWVPLFEQAGVRVAFEHHDHAYKRTVPIRAGEPSPDGIVYIGDGAWGVGVRDTHDPREVWYLERADSVRHFILVTLLGEHLDLKVITEDGDLIDHIALPRAGEVYAAPGR